MPVDKHQLAQALELENLQRVERARLADLAAHASMSPEQRRAYAESLISHAKTHGDPGSITARGYQLPAGPAGWMVQQRLAAGGAPLWDAERQLLERATSSSGTTFVKSSLQKRYSRVAQLEADFNRLDGDYSRRAEAAKLAAELQAARAELAHVEQLGDVGAYAYLSDVAHQEADAAQQRLQDTMRGPGHTTEDNTP